MKVKGANGLVFEVPDHVATGLIANGSVERVDRKSKPGRRSTSKTEPEADAE